MEEARMLLADRVCIVTGAASARGIGRATARLFAQHGGRAIILDLDADAAASAAAELGDAHRGYACDVTDKAACEGAVEKVVAEFGRVDVLVNNAGITQPIRFLGIEPRNYDAVLYNLVGIVDVNNQQADGPSGEVMAFEPLTDKLQAFGWFVQRIDGNDIEAVRAAFDAAKAHPAPQARMIVCDTRMGCGVPSSRRARKTTSSASRSTNGSSPSTGSTPGGTRDGQERTDHRCPSTDAVAAPKKKLTTSAMIASIAAEG
jgi:hypothetical protein